MQVWDRALELRLDRGATFLALGGGVIGDMTGFAAAAYQRGVHFVQARRGVRTHAVVPYWVVVVAFFGGGGHVRLFP